MPKPLDVFVYHLLPGQPKALTDNSEYNKFRVFGWTRDYETVCAVITEIPIYCYLELRPTKEQTWSRPNGWHDWQPDIRKALRGFRDIMDDDQFKMSYRNHAKSPLPIMEMELLEDKVLSSPSRVAWNADQNRYDRVPTPLLRLRFATMRKMDDYVDYLQRVHKLKFGSTYDIVLHETERFIDLPLRCFASRGMVQSGWMRFSSYERFDEDTPEPAASSHHFADVDWDIEVPCDGIDPVPGDPAPLPPRSLQVWDVETYSSKSKQKMCMPEKALREDVLFQISTVEVFATDPPGTPPTVTLYTLKKADPAVVGCRVLCFDTEAEMLAAYCENSKRIDVFTGWNLMGYDCEYMHYRCRMHRIESVYYSQGWLQDLPGRWKESSFDSKAHAAQDFRYLEAEGKLTIDMLPIIKRDYKIENYKLNTVLKRFKIGVQKDDLTAKQLFRGYENGSVEWMSRIGHYCVRDSEVCLLLWQKTGMWYALCEMSKQTGVGLLALFTKGTQIQTASQAILKLWKENKVSGCLKKFDPTKLRDRYAKRGDAGAGDDKPANKRDEKQYTGATVFSVKPGIYQWVTVLDFASDEHQTVSYASLAEVLGRAPRAPPAPHVPSVLTPTACLLLLYSSSSLYPSIMRALNSDYGTLVRDEDHPSGKDPTIPDSHCHVLTWEDHSGCLAAGTPVSLRNSAAAIEQLSQCRDVASYEASLNGTVYSRHTRLLNQGVRPCVELVMQDGRSVVCTPDHQFWTTSRGWVEAGSLDVGKDKLAAGVCAGHRSITTDLANSKNWTLDCSPLHLSFSDEHASDAALCFARILGWAMTDGHIRRTECTLMLGHALDVDDVQSDISSICGRTLKPRLHGGSWYVGLPVELSRAIVAIPGMTSGATVSQASFIPAFLLAADCPLSIIGAFLSGIFGGDGGAPRLARKGHLDTVGFFATKVAAYQDNGSKYMADIAQLLGRFNIRSSTRRQATKVNERTSFEMRIDIRDIALFQQHVGFAYCCHKALRLSAACAYYELRSRVIAQRNRTVQRIRDVRARDTQGSLSLDEAVRLGHEETRQEETILNHHYAFPDARSYLNLTRAGVSQGELSRLTLHRDHFPSAHDFLNDVGALSWFRQSHGNAAVGESKTPTSYACEAGALARPVLTLTVMSRREVGSRAVYDLSVDRTHNFLANGLVAHNCDHDTTRKRLKNGEFSKAKGKAVVCKKHYFRWLKKEYVGQGLLPEILTDALNARKTTRKVDLRRQETLLKEWLCLALRDSHANGGAAVDDKMRAPTQAELEQYQQELIYQDVLAAGQKEFTNEVVRQPWSDTLDTASAVAKRECNGDPEPSWPDRATIDATIRGALTQIMILDKRQLAHKVRANSMYGATGVSEEKGLMPLQSIAACTTYQGRTWIQFVARYVKEKYNGDCVYGDTDSVFLFFPKLVSADKDETISRLSTLITPMLKDINSNFPPEVSLEFEKIFEVLICLSKKRYLGNLCDEKGVFQQRLERGCALVRRDFIRLVKLVYKQISDRMLNEFKNTPPFGTDGWNQWKQSIYGDLCDFILSIFQRKYPTEEFILSKGIARPRSGYVAAKGRHVPGHIELWDRAEERQDSYVNGQRVKSQSQVFSAGNRLEFVAIDTPVLPATTQFEVDKETVKNFVEQDKLQVSYLEELEYFKEWSSILRLSHLWYFDHQFLKPLDELMQKVFREGSAEQAAAEALAQKIQAAMAACERDPSDLSAANQLAILRKTKLPRRKKTIMVQLFESHKLKRQLGAELLKMCRPFVDINGQLTFVQSDYPAEFLLRRAVDIHVPLSAHPPASLTKAELTRLEASEQAALARAQERAERESTGSECSGAS